MAVVLSQMLQDLQEIVCISADVSDIGMLKVSTFQQALLCRCSL